MENLEEMKNIGKTIAGKLRSVGINSPAELKSIGSVKAFWKIQSSTQEKLPVCYNLYSLEGAIQNREWTLFTEEEKTELKRLAGLIE